MLGSFLGPGCVLAMFTVCGFAQSASPAAPLETLHYSVDWRLIPAGTAIVSMKPNAPGTNQGFSAEVRLTSSGLLDKLFRVQDLYHADYEAGYCAVQSTLDASEGKRHRETKISFDRTQKKASSVERDLTANGKVVKQSEVEIPPCVHDLVGGLFMLRTLHLEPGQSANIPLSDGKKSVAAKIEAQEWEEIKTKAGTFKTLRYEAFIFNNVLYPRNARLTVWVTDDDRRLPVQLRVKMQFTIGTVTLSLEKIEASKPLATRGPELAPALPSHPRPSSSAPPSSYSHQRPSSSSSEPRPSSLEPRPSGSGLLPWNGAVGPLPNGRGSEEEGRGSEDNGRGCELNGSGSEPPESTHED